MGDLLRRVNAAEGGALQIDTTAHAARDYVHLDDVITALLAIG